MDECPVKRIAPGTIPHRLVSDHDDVRRLNTSMDDAQERQIYEVEHDGVFEAISNGQPWIGTFEIGIVLSKTNRRFLCHYAKVTGPQGQEWVGKSRWSLETAVRSQLQQMVDDGVQLESVGPEEMWCFESESGGFLRAS